MLGRKQLVVKTNEDICKQLEELMVGKKIIAIQSTPGELVIIVEGGDMFSVEAIPVLNKASLVIAWCGQRIGAIT